jgi:hypothetical protein
MSSEGGRGDGDGSDQGDWIRSGLNAHPRGHSRRWGAVGALTAAGVIAVGTAIVFQGGGGGTGATAPPDARPGTTAATQTMSSGGTAGQSPSLPSPSLPSPSLPPTASLPPSSPAPGYIEAGGNGGYAYVFEQPSLASRVVATIPQGTVVYIICTRWGDVVLSPDGRSSEVWDYISPTDVAPGGYVPDAWVYTGTDERTRPECE